MNATRSILAGGLCLALFGGCANPGPGTGSTPTSATPGGGGGTGASPGASSTMAPVPGGPGATPVAPGGAGTIVGTITFHMTLERSDDTIHQVLRESLDFSVDVRLARDTSFDPEETYVDDGSTYTVNVLNTTERQVGDCLATSETKANATHAFSDQPTSYENSISARVDRNARNVVFQGDLSWIYDLTANACDGRPPYTGEYVVSFFCPFFGLTAKLTEGSGTDQIDAACQLPGGETYAGTLTLTR